MGDGNLADVAKRNAQTELHLVDVFAGVLAAIHHQVKLHARRTESVGVRDRTADFSRSLGSAISKRVVYDASERIQGGAVYLASGDGAEAA